MRSFLAIVSAAALACSAPTAAATLIVEGGLLTGATGVDVSGTLYNVSFIDGTCANVFSGCDDIDDFNFGNKTSALAAAQALRDQVFIDRDGQLFDSNPYLTRGCSYLICQAMLPYEFFAYVSQNELLQAAFATNSFIERFDVAKSGLSFMADSSDDLSRVWAVFSPVQSPVPEPATWVMMLVGFGVIGLGMRRRKAMMLVPA